MALRQHLATTTVVVNRVDGSLRGQAQLAGQQAEASIAPIGYYDEWYVFATAHEASLQAGQLPSVVNDGCVLLVGLTDATANRLDADLQELRRERTIEIEFALESSGAIGYLCCQDQLLAVAPACEPWLAAVLRDCQTAEAATSRHWRGP